VNETQSQFLRDYLADADVECPGCGYNLRGLTGSVCPECGDEIRLQIGLTEPKLAANISGLIGLSAGAGFNGLLLLYCFIIALSRNASPDEMVGFVAANLVGLCVEGFCVSYWLYRWRPIRRLDPLPRWLLVAGCWFLSLLNVVIFAIVVRG
jgi:hypothetical protein